MPVTPFIIEAFGGLNVADDPQEMGTSGSVAVNNVDFDKRGRIRTRNGFSAVKNLTLTALGGFATFESTAGLKQAVVGYQNGATKKYEAYDAGGGSAVASATPADTSISAVRIGTPSGQFLYIANGVDTIWRWDGSAFSQPSDMPIASHLTASPASNRLVAGNISGNVNRLYFSDPGEPETITYDSGPPETGNFVDLAPGDGGAVMGLASWQNNVYAFKPGRFFVFTGEGLGAAGNPIFNYRTVDGYGAIVPPVAGDEGVYFFDGRSVWLTDGDIPLRVSRNVEAIFRGEAPLVGFTPDTLDQAKLSSAVLSYALGRLYMSMELSDDAGRVVLVYDPKIDAWTVYQTGLSWFAPLRRAATDQGFVYAFGETIADTPSIYYLDPTRYTDFWDGGVEGAAVIDWYLTTGYYAVAPAEQVAVVGYTGLVGGALDAGGESDVDIDLTTDLMTATGLADFSAAANPLGDIEAWTMADCEGRRWQMQLRGSGGQYVSRATHEVTHVKAPGVV